MWRYDKTPWYDRDVTLKRGSRCVDYIAVIKGLKPHLEGYEAMDRDEKFNTYHIWNAADLNLENLFQENLFELDSHGRTKLELRISIHR